MTWHKCTNKYGMRITMTYALSERHGVMAIVYKDPNGWSWEIIRPITAYRIARSHKYYQTRTAAKIGCTKNLEKIMLTTKN